MNCQCMDHLYSDHQLIQRGLGILSELALRMKSGEDVRPEDVRSLLEFFDRFADGCHDLKEESILFPALGHAAPPTAYDSLASLRFQHDQSRSMIEAMDDALYRKSATDFHMFATHFSRMLDTHIKEEEQVLPPLVSGYLTADDDARIHREFRQIDAELTGTNTCGFLSLINTLERRYLSASAQTAANSCSF